MKAISILNLKGGVGKTVTSVNMAYILAADHKKRVLLADCDSQCNATEFYGLTERSLYGVADVMLGTCEVILRRQHLRDGLRRGHAPGV